MICIKYDNPKMENVNKADQIKIEFRPQDKTLKQFLILNRDKKIYMEVVQDDFFNNKEYMQLLKELKEDAETGEWTLQIPIKMLKDVNQESIKVDKTKLEILKECAPHYMFTDLIGNWETLEFIVSLKPSEVYITNILCFSMHKLYPYLTEQNNIGIRLYANWAQSAWEDSPALKKFFIRPEDVQYYEPFVSGIELMGPAAIQDTLWEAYAVDKKWNGNLGEIIIGLTENLDSTRLPKLFGKARLICEKRCICGRQCTICQTSREFAETLDKIGMQIKS